jgi:hypothetical protein
MKITKRQLRRIIKEEKRKLLREVTPSEREEALRLNAIDVGEGGIDYEARDKKALSDVYMILSDLESDLMIDSGQGQGKEDTFEQKLMGRRAEEYRTEVLRAMDLLESMGAIG